MQTTNYPINRRGRVISPSARYVNDNYLGNPFGKRSAKKSTPAASIPAPLAPAPAPAPVPVAHIPAIAPIAVASPPLPPAFVPIISAPVPVEPPVVEMDDASDEPPPLISIKELRERQRQRQLERQRDHNRHMRSKLINPKVNKTAEGWITIDAYRRKDGVIEIDLNEPAF